MAKARTKDAQAWVHARRANLAIEPLDGQGSWESMAGAGSHLSAGAASNRAPGRIGTAHIPSEIPIASYLPGLSFSRQIHLGCGCTLICWMRILICMPCVALLTIPRLTMS